MIRLIFLFLITPLLVTAQVPKKYPSLLWKITGNGTRKPSYLYGTMHVSNRVAWHLTEEFFNALKSVDVVGLETHPGEWLDNMEKTGELEELAQNTYQNMYRGDFYRSTFFVSFPEKKMLQAILSYDPDIINGLLYRQNKSQENFEEDTYVDLFIFQSASKLNKKVISLEDFAESQIKARLSALPDDTDQARQNRRRGYNDGSQLEDAYRAGDLDLLDSLNQSQFSNNARKYLLDDRNVFFINTMDSVLKTSTLFAGVGAAHLPGPNGVIELLRKKGYTVEPVMGRVSKKSSMAREELEGKIKPVSFSTQTMPDSAFSMELPGKVYPIYDVGGLKYYIHPDMVNGAFYTVVRLQHVGPVFHITPRDLQQRVDSLLFESIPGKIISKKEIRANDGSPGIEIVNRTVKGDQQHYRIYFTDLEMLVFKIGGKGNYATSKEAERFLNSVQFKAGSARAVSFTPPTGGFSVNLPQNYNYAKKNGAAPVGVVEELNAYDAGKKQYYALQRAVYNDFEYLEEDTFELTRFTKHILENFKFNNSKKFTLYREQSFPAVMFSATDDKGSQMNGKVIIKGVHYYFVYQVTEKSGSGETAFLDSFKLTDFKHVNKLRNVRDVDFCFQVQDEVSDNASSKFNEAYAKAYQKIAPRKDSAQQQIDFRSAAKYYYSPSTNEYINIAYERYNRYDYRTRHEIEERIDETYRNSGMIVLNKKTSVNDKSFTYRATLCDTATSRGILKQVYFKNGMMHELTVPFDTTLGLKGWAAGFMETFAPLDTLADHDIFKKKFDLLVKDLSGDDTTKKRQAEQSFPQIGLHKEYADEFITLLSNPSLSKISEDTRAQLFVTGGTLRDDRIIPHYSKLYKQYSDSFYLQLSVLKGLAFLKSKAGFSAFASLLVGEPPLVGEQTSVMDVFSVLQDSLELCKPLVKDLLKLTRYDEYRDPVYALVSELVSRNITSPETYGDHRATLADDALLTIKRYNPASEQPAGKSTDRQSYFPTEGFINSHQQLNDLTSLSEISDHSSFQQRPPLVSYGFLLAPFYKSDAKAADFFTRLGRVKDPAILIPVCVELLKYGHRLNDSIVESLSRNNETRFLFYSALKEKKLGQYFPKAYLNQQTLLESLLNSQQETIQVGKKLHVPRDTFSLVARIPATNKFQQGELYVFKNSADKYSESHWMTFFVNTKDGEVSHKVELVNPDFYTDPRKTQQENLDLLLDRFLMSFRKRALPAMPAYN